MKPPVQTVAQIATSLALIGLVACGPGRRELQVIQGRTMGTTFVVKVVPEGARPLPMDSLEAEINRVLREVNRQMSTYLPDSEISRFNRSRSTEWFPISSDFARVLRVALEISEASEGAFDVTVAPLVNLWGFGPEARPQRVPTEEALRQRQAWVGYRKLAVRLQPPAVKKAHPRMAIDLSAIAKGFGVDRVGELLEQWGLRNYMVEIGGEVRVRGRNPDGGPWRIGIRSPDAEAGLQKVVELSDAALATSGDYFNYFEENGVRYSHTLDPRTGRPITHKLASVTVIHPSCTYADALATAIDVLGPDAGYAFAQSRRLPVYMIVRQGGGFVEKATPEFWRFSP